MDGTGPTIDVCPTVTTVLLDENGMVTMDVSQYEATDNCDEEDPTITFSQTMFDCGDTGNNDVTITFTDSFGNANNCTTAVAVIDSTAPTALCMDVTLELGADGEVEFDADDADNGSTDNCDFTFSVSDARTYTCSDVGSSSNTLFAIDEGGKTE